ncbi:hypothetical protein CLOSAC_12910 [Clostridium saccharobutylicum]|uniref:Uncharacterized protein n=1 Tax=Clostridium saccharobutylicum TaxID=169679 RepID=A0A1S8NDE4_CLOSA|nr:hypothetical protein CLOSAC_12910 [Clostridium saccharobutylicum]
MLFKYIIIRFLEEGLSRGYILKLIYNKKYSDNYHITLNFFYLLVNTYI